MTRHVSIAEQIARSAMTFEEHRLGRKPTSVTVVIGGYSLVIAIHGVLSPAEQIRAAGPEGTVQFQQFHQWLFQLCSNPLRREIQRITGFELRDTAKGTAAVKVFSGGTVIQLFLLAGRLPSDSWGGM